VGESLAAIEKHKIPLAEAATSSLEALKEYSVAKKVSLVFADPAGVVARLQLAKAFASAGDTAKAKSAYQDFLNLWKEADPEIPILKKAKAEYDGLR